MENENLYPFRSAKLYDCSQDLSKRWYISFYVWSVQLSTLVRKKDYSINQYETVDERKAYAKQRIKQINQLLSDGYHIDIAKKEEAEIIKNITSLESALNGILKIKEKSLKHNSVNSFRSAVNIFLKWAKKKGYDNTNVKYFTAIQAIEFLDDLLLNQGRSAKTINKYNDYLKVLFNELFVRKHVESNPFVGIKKRKELISYKNVAFSDNEITKLKEKIINNDSTLWLFIQFIYYCYLRPNEIRQLKIGHIDILKKKIFVPAEISKNSKEDWIEIPAPFVKTLKQFLKGKNKIEYLFPGENKNSPIGKNTMTMKHKSYIDDLKFSKEHTLYSWKHTGVIHAYKANVDIKSIQRQCRHSSLEMTDNYLKSLGLYDNLDFIMKMPSI